jgi:hypothetical protein
MIGTREGVDPVRNVVASCRVLPQPCRWHTIHQDPPRESQAAGCPKRSSSRVEASAVPRWADQNPEASVSSPSSVVTQSAGLCRGRCTGRLHYRCRTHVRSHLRLSQPVFHCCVNQTDRATEFRLIQVEHRYSRHCQRRLSWRHLK